MQTAKHQYCQNLSLNMSILRETLEILGGNASRSALQPIICIGLYCGLTLLDSLLVLAGNWMLLAILIICYISAI